MDTQTNQQKLLAAILVMYLGGGSQEELQKLLKLYEALVERTSYLENRR